MKLMREQEKVREAADIVHPAFCLQAVLGEFKDVAVGAEDSADICQLGVRGRSFLLLRLRRCFGLVLCGDALERID